MLLDLTGDSRIGQSPDVWEVGLCLVARDVCAKGGGGAVQDDRDRLLPRESDVADGRTRVQVSRIVRSVATDECDVCVIDGANVGSVNLGELSGQAPILRESASALAEETGNEWDSEGTTNRTASTGLRQRKELASERR